MLDTIKLELQQNYVLLAMLLAIPVQVQPVQLVHLATVLHIEQSMVLLVHVMQGTITISIMCVSLVIHPVRPVLLVLLVQLVHLLHRLSSVQRAFADVQPPIIGIQLVLLVLPVTQYAQLVL